MLLNVYGVGMFLQVENGDYLELGTQRVLYNTLSFLKDRQE